MQGDETLVPASRRLGIYALSFSHRDVTDHLQLLLRKAGHHLHTTAEREVVRTIKEKCCYIALFAKVRAALSEKNLEVMRDKLQEIYRPHMVGVLCKQAQFSDSVGGMKRVKDGMQEGSRKKGRM